VSTPIIGREGLLRLARLVERLRSRELDEGDASWMAPTQTPADDVHSDEAAGGGVLWTSVLAARRQKAFRTLSVLVERMAAAPCPTSGESGGEHDAAG
jgi:hypothetical protein